ncbi:cytosol aminopeptidase-like [Eupeodes corollae]|uniref:cytosol aminopeptidase-like n=1 Tax=Eupeodes corollae TaxID=290404 RepID=UPI0024932844|nr:cytosol aminopeptidase-like [Eupeodes corollae]
MALRTIYRSLRTIRSISNPEKQHLNFQNFRRFISSDDQHKVSKGLVLGLYEKEDDKPVKLTTSGEKFDEKVQGTLMHLIKESELTGKIGTGNVFNNVDSEYRSVAVVGLGREGAGFNELEMLDEGLENVRAAAGVGARKLQMQGCIEVYVDSMDYPEQAAEGSGLSIYRYQENKKKNEKTNVPKLELYDSSETNAWTRGIFKADAQNLARKLTDAPSNLMTPTLFAQATVDALCPCGMTVEIRAMDWIQQNHLNSFLYIAKGSCEPPILLEINYCGTAPEDKPVLLVGKGITFNSGGICLRKARQMDQYRGSMAGAAVVVAAIRAAASLSLPINIAAVIPLCENMPSGMSCKPGDVITCLNGQILAIEQTNKAGVVVMADPLVYAQKAYKPRMVIDVGTMGNGVIKGIGSGAAAVFSNSHFIWKQLQKAGSITGDRVWRMPLWKYYKSQVRNSISYDISNTGTGLASSCLAAAVLNEFVPTADWAHLDIRGVGMITREGAIPYLLRNRMTGRPTRTLIQFLYQMACSEQSNKSCSDKSKKS